MYEFAYTEICAYCLTLALRDALPIFRTRGRAASSSRSRVDSGRCGIPGQQAPHHVRLVGGDDDLEVLAGADVLVARGAEPRCVVFEDDAAVLLGAVLGLGLEAAVGLQSALDRRRVDGGPEGDEQPLLGVAVAAVHVVALGLVGRSEEHTSELQSLMRISYAVLCLK